MVSNCYTASHRERYVLELQKHISVDIYGSCESVVKNKSQLLSCPKQLDQKCWDQIDQNYKVDNTFSTRNNDLLILYCNQIYECIYISLFFHL